MSLDARREGYSEPFCPYCQRHVYHKEKEPCKQYSAEKAVAHRQKVEKEQMHQQYEAEEKAALLEEMGEFASKYPRYFAVLEKLQIAVADSERKVASTNKDLAVLEKKVAVLERNLRSLGSLASKDLPGSPRASPLW